MITRFWTSTHEVEKLQKIPRTTQFDNGQLAFITRTQDSWLSVMSIVLYLSQVGVAKAKLSHENTVPTLKLTWRQHDITLI